MESIPNTKPGRDLRIINNEGEIIFNKKYPEIDKKNITLFNSNVIINDPYII